MYFLSINKFRQDADGAEIGRQIGKHGEWTKGRIAEGRIVQAGKWGDAGGMSIVKAQDLDEARLLLTADPLVDSGLVTFEVAQLYPDVPIE